MFERKTFITVFKIFDLLIMVLAFLLATIAVHYHSYGISFKDFLSMRIKLGNFILFSCILYAWSANLSLFTLYQSKRLYNYKEEFLDILKAVTIGTLIFLVISWLFKITLVTPGFVVIFWLAAILATIISRVCLRYLLAVIRRRGRNLRFMLIVGTNGGALGFARFLQGRTELGYRILGFVDNDWPGLEEFRKSDFILKGNLSQIPTILRDQVVDEVAIFLPVKSLYQETSHIISQCEEQGVTVRLFSDIFESRLTRGKTDLVDSKTALTIYPGAIIGWQAVVKRVIDFSISLALLLIFSPLFGAAALAIKLTSKGPVLFIQERVGLNKRRFRLFKFRTMVPDAEQKIAALEHLNEVDGPAFKIKNDPRITPVGRFLRKTSIDELPQLLNVLIGDMSLVGPRPLPVRDYNGFSQDWQRRRFSVLPGITCLWQINGRNNINFERWMHLDLQYIDQWSLWLDLMILLKTIPAVLRGVGAA